MIPANGLYDPAFEHDACGVAFVATMSGEPSHEIVQHALTALRNLEHRGASGSEPDSGDGAGILIQVPDALFRDMVEFDLPRAGSMQSAPRSCRPSPARPRLPSSRSSRSQPMRA